MRGTLHPEVAFVSCAAYSTNPDALYAIMSSGAFVACGSRQSGYRAVSGVVRAVERKRPLPRVTQRALMRNWWCVVSARGRCVHVRDLHCPCSRPYRVVRHASAAAIGASIRVIASRCFILPSSITEIPGFLLPGFQNMRPEPLPQSA